MPSDTNVCELIDEFLKALSEDSEFINSLDDAEILHGLLEKVILPSVEICNIEEKKSIQEIG